MNKTAIEWCDLTWNPLTGCLTGCPYCYARKIATRFAGTKAFPNGFAPTWHPERLDEPLKLKTPSRIFAGSMTDFFGPWMMRDYLDQVLDVIESCPQHTFYMLTKWPQIVFTVLYGAAEDRPVRYLGGGDYIENLWIGASVDTAERAEATWRPMEKMRRMCGFRLFVSIEPMLTEIDVKTMLWADWIIIGAQSGVGAAQHKPERKWVENILGFADRLARPLPIFLKDSITALWPDLRRQEWPQ